MALQGVNIYIYIYIFSDPPLLQVHIEDGFGGVAMGGAAGQGGMLWGGVGRGPCLPSVSLLQRDLERAFVELRQQQEEEVDDVDEDFAQAMNSIHRTGQLD